MMQGYYKMYPASFLPILPTTLNNTGKTQRICLPVLQTFILHFLFSNKATNE
ncbi:MAG: hypothetical protein LBE82_12180 [Chitinophagaceae bacterium]|jgi:hypothetical protein|nr:hypothetical protein [Chitinophagaceae bacterium]